MRHVSLAALLSLLSLGAACGDKDDDSGTAGDPAAECTTMCTSVGFDAGTADVYDHEVNCTCSGGSGEVTDASCTDLCDGLGWSSAEAYSTEACQCS